MKVLLSSASFALEYGGPAYSVFNLAKHLKVAGLDVAVWSPDGTAVAAAKVWGKDGENARALAGSLRDALSDFGTPDVFHDSGLWWRHNMAISSAARALKRPSVISIRGMLEPAALRHREWRKRIAWLIYQRKNLTRATALHVTGEVEERNVKALQLPTKVVCIPNGIDVPQQCPIRLSSHPKRLIFLGRLHTIKGLSMLLEAWARLRPLNWHLEIAGPDEDRQQSKLEGQIRELGIERSVSFSGPVQGEEKEKLFQRASLLVLPSFSENFGLAAGEALAHGVPVIATHGTPWAALHSEGCGWHVATSVDGLEGGLKKALATPDDELAAMGRRGYAYVARTFSWSRIANQMVALYQDVCADHRAQKL